MKSKTLYQFKYSEIEEIWYIMMSLSDTMFSYVDCATGKKGTYILFNEAIMSVMNTIVSIDFCCDRSAYSDAYTLVRKYRDDLMQYLFILNIIQNIHRFPENIDKNIFLIKMLL